MHRYPRLMPRVLATAAVLAFLAWPARVAKVEFLGAFCLVGIALDAADVPPLVANVPRQVADGIGLAPGQAITVSLPPGAMRVLG